MSNKKLEKFNNYFTLTVILFLLFVGYITAVVFVNNSNLSWTASNGNFQLILKLFFTEKSYSSPVSVLIGWGATVVLSYVLGFIVAGVGWSKERKKRMQAEGQANGLKGKLGKIENERDFYKKKYEILEKGINSSAPPADKKPGGKGKPQNKKSPLIALLIALLVGGAVCYQLFYANKTESQIIHFKIGIPENTNNSNTQK